MGWGEPHQAAVPVVFNEDSLRAAVVGVWGEAGAHVDVLDRIIGLARDAGALGDDLVETAGIIDQLTREMAAQRAQALSLARDLRTERDRREIAERNLAACTGRLPFKAQRNVSAPPCDGGDMPPAEYRDGVAW